MKCEARMVGTRKPCDHPAKHLVPYDSSVVCGIHARAYLRCIPLTELETLCGPLHGERVMIGQLAVPLHHVERVGDIAVLPDAMCPECGLARGAWLDNHCSTCGGAGGGPLPVVGQVVAHVEKCATCDGAGCDIDFCCECGDEYDDPCPRHMDHEHDVSDDACCVTCGGSGWVRDQYVRVTEVLPIVDTEVVTWDFDGYPCVVHVGNGRCAVYRRERSPHGGPYYVDGDYFDLPGAVPGGVALIVEPAVCPECDGTEVGPAAVPCRCDDHPCGACAFPVPVSSPSAPYTESE